jgi:predicted TIM-barrel fold metal-dependent hydrolase
VIDFQRATSEIAGLNLKKESKQSLLWKNAARVYGLGSTDGFDWRT